jgi:hypothetical protein
VHLNILINDVKVSKGKGIFEMGAKYKEGTVLDYLELKSNFSLVKGEAYMKHELNCIYKMCSQNKLLNVSAAAK